MAIKFSGINITSKDAYKAYEFYKGLGLTVKEIGDDPNSKWWNASFHINGSTLWILKDHSGENAENTGRATIQIVLGFDGLDDMQESYKKYKSMGYAVSEPEKQFYGGWEMNLIDLDGNMILFLD